MLGNRNPWNFENEDMQENFSKVTKYTFRTIDRANQFIGYMTGCPTDTLYLQERRRMAFCFQEENWGQVVYAVHPSLQSDEWNETQSTNGLDLGKLEAIMVYDGEGSYIGLKRWNKEGQLIKDYLKGEYNRHDFGEPIQP